MRLEGFLADFVSTLVNDNGRDGIETGAEYLTFPPAPMPDQALEVWQDATKFYSKSYLAWLTYVDLLMSALSSSNVLSES